MDLYVPMIKPLYARSIVVWDELAEIWDLPFSLSIYRKPPYYILTEACCWNGTLKVSLKWDTPEAGGLMEQERGWENIPEQTWDGVLAFLDPTTGCLCLTSFLSLSISPFLQGQFQVPLAIKESFWKTGNQSSQVWSSHVGALLHCLECVSLYLTAFHGPESRG